MNRHHRIDYIELRVDDLSRAKAFYGAAFGWEFNDYGDAYVGIRNADGTGEVGGFAPAEEVVPGGPLVILYSDDLEGTRRAVLDAGGEITVEPFDFPGGRRFHFADSVGNELAVWHEGATH